MRRPGPARLRAGLVPGGVVIRVYDLAEHLLIEHRFHPGDDVEGVAGAAGEFVDAVIGDGDAVVLVAYDGDTGVRFPADAWGFADPCGCTGGTT